MNLSRAEIVVYAVLAAGTWLLLALGIPAWVAGVAGLACALAFGYLHFRFPFHRALQPGKPGGYATRIVVLGLVAIAALVLAELGVPAGVIAMLCALVLVPYAYETLSARNPRVEAYALLAVSLAFCAIGLFLVFATAEWRTGVVTLAIFGSAALLFAVVILGRRRARRFRALRVSIVGGRDFHAGEGIHFVGLSLGLVGVGAVVLFVADAPWPVRAIGAVLALVGLVLLALRAFGVLGRQFLRFEAGGIVFGMPRFQFRLPWDDIAAVAAHEFAYNPLVLIVPLDVAALEVTPASARTRLYRYLRQNALLGAPIAFMPSLFGLEIAPLVAALERYRADPGARRELAARDDGRKALDAPAA